jgi:hypothetical protein
LLASKNNSLIVTTHNNHGHLALHSEEYLLISQAMPAVAQIKSGTDLAQFWQGALGGQFDVLSIQRKYRRAKSA